MIFKPAVAPVSCEFHDSDEPSCFYWPIMEKLKASKIAHWSDKLAVESEPGLTTAQLMLQSVHGHQI